MLTGGPGKVGAENVAVNKHVNKSIMPILLNCLMKNAIGEVWTRM